MTKANNRMQLLLKCLILFLSFKKCVAYTGNNMRKQTPVADKKEKDVSEPLQMCVVGSPVFSFATIFFIYMNVLILIRVLWHDPLMFTHHVHFFLPSALWGGPFPCIPSLHWRELETVFDETRKTKNIKRKIKAQNWQKVRTTVKYCFVPSFKYKHWDI